MAPHLGVSLPLVLLVITTGTRTPAQAENIVRPLQIDSGSHDNLTNQSRIVFRQRVSTAGAPWQRIVFGAFTLPPGSSIVLRTTTGNAAKQTLDSDSLRSYCSRSAFLAGSELTIELVAGPRTRSNRILVHGVEVGRRDAQPATLCGSDDRVLSADVRQGRIMPPGCTGFMISPDVGLTAGHCVRTGQLIEFNVPLSKSNGDPQPPPPEDQYPIVWVASQASGFDDWAVFRVGLNSNTGLLPNHGRGFPTYPLGSPGSLRPFDTLRVTGYGEVTAPVDPRWSLVQKSHEGPLLHDTSSAPDSSLLHYAVDATPGNSGSPIVLSRTGEVVAVHTHGACNPLFPDTLFHTFDKDAEGWDTTNTNPVSWHPTGGSPDGHISMDCPVYVRHPFTKMAAWLGHDLVFDAKFEGFSSTDILQVKLEGKDTGAEAQVSQAGGTELGGGWRRYRIRLVQSAWNTYSSTLQSVLDSLQVVVFDPSLCGSGSRLRLDNIAFQQWDDTSSVPGGNIGNRVDRPALAAAIAAALKSGIQPRIGSFGNACAHSGGIPALQVQGRSALGGQLQGSVANLPNSSIGGLFFVGFSRSSWGLISLPLPLSFLGRSDCSLLARPDFMLLGALANGTATLSLPIPSSSDLLACTLFQQFMLFETNAGIATTNGIQALIGN